MIQTVNNERGAPPSQARIENAARQLENQFTRMLIKQMRASTPGDPLAGRNNVYREMHDQQLANQLTAGRGLGMQPQLIKSLGGVVPAKFQQIKPVLGNTSNAKTIPLGNPVKAEHVTPMTLASAGGASFTTGAKLLPLPPAATAYIGTVCKPGQADCSSKEAFVASVWPAAEAAASELGVAPEALVAQAALESNWGRNMPKSNGVSSNNLFGIKAGKSWQGATMTASTTEVVNGKERTESATFRAYSSIADSFRDYAKVIGQQRYDQARQAGSDIQAYASALQRAGYATDPAYADKVVAVANSPAFQRASRAVPAFVRG